MLRRIRLAINILMLSLLVTACTGGGTAPTAFADIHPIDPVLEEFYSLLGGREVLGEVISPAVVKDGIISQVTEAGEMTYNDKAPIVSKFGLAPLGRELKIGASSDTNWEVGEVFKAKYDQLLGEVFVGKPLTGVINNSEKGRDEQYFENLGFYQGAETGGEVRLLPYGAWHCGEACRSSLPLDAAPILPVPTSLPTAEPTPLPPTPVPTMPEAPQIAGTASPNTEAPTQPAAPVQPSYRWLVQIWEVFPLVSDKQSQEIKVEIQRDGSPSEGAQASLIVELPDGSVLNEDFPPADVTGVTRQKLNPIHAKNGAVIPYQVCVHTLNGDQYCVQKSFSIWSKP